MFVSLFPPFFLKDEAKIVKGWFSHVRSFVSSWSWRSRLGQRCRWSQWIPFKTWKTRRFFLGGHILEVPCHILVASPRNWVRLIYTILLETFKSLELELRRMFFSPFLGITWGSPSLIYFDEKNPQEWDTQQPFGTIQWFENPVNGYIWSIEWFNHTFERLPGISRDGPHLDPFIFFGPTYVWFQPISRGNPIVCPTILVQLFLERAGQTARQLFCTPTLYKNQHQRIRKGYSK